MKTTLKRGASLALCMVLTNGLFAMTGCKASDETSKDPLTINVKMIDGGYGSAWIEEIKEKFEDYYKDVGYKVNIMTPVEGYSGSQALSEMRNNVNGIDLFISEGVDVDDVLDEEYGVCAVNLNDVYNSKAINFDGTESEQTIKDSSKEIRKYVSSGDDFYAYYWYKSPSGLVVNTSLLAEYSEITELPRTTDELFAMYDIILDKYNQVGAYPIAWGGDNAYGYTLSPLFTHMAQMLGVEEYDQLFSLDYVLNEDGTVKRDGWEKTANKDLIDILEVYFHLFDTEYSTVGSLSQRHDDAHAQVMMDRAVFTFDGSYFLNEVNEDFSTKLNNVDFIKVPVISALGVKLGLDGNNGADEAKCDEVLSCMVKLIDEDKTKAQIKSETESACSVTLTEEMVDRVYEARRSGYFGLRSSAYISSESTMQKTDIAKLFLRMLASQDAADTKAKYSLCSAYATGELKSDEAKFIKSAQKIIASTDYITSTDFYVGSVRKQCQRIFLIPSLGAASIKDAVAIMGAIDNVKNRDYAYYANAYYYGDSSLGIKGILPSAENNWGTYMGYGGYKLEEVAGAN